MFKTMSNNMFNNKLFNSSTIAAMHDQMKRLYQAAKSLKNIEGKSRLALALDASPQALNNWEERGISKQGMLKAQEVIGCSASWLETGKGSMSIVPVQPAKNVEYAELGMRKIPLISFVQAGHMNEAVDPYAVGDAEDWVQTNLELSDNAFALRIKGDSMEPDFKEGDIIIIDPNIQALPGDFVVAKNSDEEATFKKYRPRWIDEHSNYVFELIPLNEDYPMLRSDRTPIRIIGVMVEHRRYRKR